MITAANFTDFMYRPAGRGAGYGAGRRRAVQQAAHQGISCGYWARAGAQRAGGAASLDPARRAEGAYTAFLDSRGRRRIADL